MKIAYFDCIAGASGDMLLGALLDAGLPLDELRRRLADLPLPGFRLEARPVVKNGFRATKVDVIVVDTATERRLAEIEALLQAGSLPERVHARALAIFRRLAAVEAGIHARPVEEVHLHELGGIDTLVDVCGVLLGLEALGVERVVASPLPLGRGFVRGAHGAIPLPAPATLALLQGVPVTGSEIDMELVTPTGAALLVSLAESFGPIPPMTLEAVGYGAGGRDLPIPNLVRLLLGHASGASGPIVERLVSLETNIDDLNPQVYEHVMARLFAAGALDVWLAPVQMKKNRPATLLCALCRPAGADALEAILFAETSTLGVRRQEVERRSLPRAFATVETPYGAVRVKIADLGGGQRRIAPEYDDCRRLAGQHGVPLTQVMQSALLAAEKLGEQPA